jgi:hypothetical protein
VPETTRYTTFARVVSALMDAREDTATYRFDAELERAVQRGDVTAEAASRLRRRQRASVQAVAEHACTVLPAALAALESAQHRAAVSDREDATAPDREDSDSPLAKSLGPAEHDTPGPASTPGAAPPSSLEERRQRMIVADLVATPPHVQTDHR